ncbi:MAG: hypothetical protein A2Y93_00480 [Chloroflexi bacterium RBG_13_68_17]|nr:MAG: hypothetical protein A2Y93_00480 [Chloroflexi bacterium RBG_13_68_17]
MSNWRILVTDGLAPQGLATLRQQAEVVEAAGLEELPDVDGLIIRSRTLVTGEDLRRAQPRLRVVGRAGVGVDNIDVAAARQVGVIVVNAPLASTDAVAEHTLALMLALARRLPQADASLRRGEWRKSEFLGTELGGKTLGLIGLGRIGAAVAERARALGMAVVAYDPLLSPEEIAVRGARPLGLQALLAEADYLSLHVPLTPETRGLLDAHALARLRPGARLVCTARGGLVDEAALLAALDTGRLAGAALDVFEEEPPRPGPLLNHPALILTPHIAAQTVEAQARAALDIVAEVLAALRGQGLRWQIA